MLKYNKFLLGLLTTLGFATASVNTNAEIVDTLEFGTHFYLLESLESSEGNTYTLYEYDMNTGGTGVATLFQVSNPPTALGYDGTNFYISAANQLRAYTSSGQSSFVRNLITDAKDIIAAGNYLIILLGAPANEIITINKITGALIDRTPQLPAEDMFPIFSIYYDVADDRVIAQLEDSGANPDGSQYMAATFDSVTGVLGDLTTIPVEAPYDAPTGLSENFFLGNLQMAMDASGNVVEFSDGDIIFSHGDTTSVNARRYYLTPYFNNSTDNVIDFATDDNTYAYFTMTLDNECNTYADPGGSRVARWYKENNYLEQRWNGYLQPTTHYYDTQNAIHTLAADDTNVFLFYGEGDDLSVEVISDADFTYPYHPWRNASYNPSNANMSSVSQNTAFTLKDNQTIAMHIEDGCDHYVGFWSTVSNSFVGHTETKWFDPIDAAYVADMNSYFIAFTDGTNYWIRNLSTINYESENANNLSISNGFGTGGINLLIDAGDYLVVSYSTSDGTDSIGSLQLGPDTDDTGLDPVGAQDLEFVSIAIDLIITNCCGSWTSAAYSDNEFNAGNGRIFFTTGDGLFAIDINKTDGSFSGPDGGAALQSTHYGSTHTIPDNPYMSLSSDGNYLFVDAQVYDTSTLQYVDSVDIPADIGLFLDTVLYTFDRETSTYNTMTFNLGGGDVVGPSDSGTDVTGTLAALLPISSGASTVPLTLSTTSNGTLVVTTNGSQTATTGGGGVSGGGDEGGDDDDSGDTGGGGSGCEVTNQCVQAPGGGGGGPVDLLLLLGLTGLGIRQLRKLNRHL